MANFGVVSLITTLACFLPSPPFLSAAAEELAAEVCKNTSDYTFCLAAIYSDPRAATADRYGLIEIVIRKAFENASDTSVYISSTIKSGAGKFDNLRDCERGYNKAVETLLVMSDNVNSKYYNGLVKLSLALEGYVDLCLLSLQGTTTIDERNQNMLKLVNICYHASKLF